MSDERRWNEIGLMAEQGPHDVYAQAILDLKESIKALEKAGAPWVGYQELVRRAAALEGKPKACYFADVCPVSKPEPEPEPEPVFHSEETSWDWDVRDKAGDVIAEGSGFRRATAERKVKRILRGLGTDSGAQGTLTHTETISVYEGWMHNVECDSDD